MQKIPPDEFKSADGNSAVSVASGLAVAKSDLSVLKRIDPIVGYGDLEDIWSQVFDALLTGADGLAVHNEVFLPNL